ncbi:MAG: hypothetical protein K2X66_18580 [Cyanobacteria bacterium]|nr:hypothetical protein [Cyanobacteriota bacterium]
MKNNQTVDKAEPQYLQMFFSHPKIQELRSPIDWELAFLQMCLPADKWNEIYPKQYFQGKEIRPSILAGNIHRNFIDLDDGEKLELLKKGLDCLPKFDIGLLDLSEEPPSLISGRDKPIELGRKFGVFSSLLVQINETHGIFRDAFDRYVRNNYGNTKGPETGPKGWTIGEILLWGYKTPFSEGNKELHEHIAKLALCLLTQRDGEFKEPIKTMWESLSEASRDLDRDRRNRVNICHLQTKYDWLEALYLETNIPDYRYKRTYKQGKGNDSFTSFINYRDYEVEFTQRRKELWEAMKANNLRQGPNLNNENDFSIKIEEFKEHLRIAFENRRDLKISVHELMHPERDQLPESFYNQFFLNVLLKGLPFFQELERSSTLKALTMPINELIRKPDSYWTLAFYEFYKNETILFENDADLKIELENYINRQLLGKPSRLDDLVESGGEEDKIATITKFVADVRGDIDSAIEYPGNKTLKDLIFKRLEAISHPSLIHYDRHNYGDALFRDWIENPQWLDKSPTNETESQPIKEPIQSIQPEIEPSTKVETKDCKCPYDLSHLNPEQRERFLYIWENKPTPIEMRERFHITQTAVLNAIQTINNKMKDCEIKKVNSRYCVKDLRFSTFFP